MHLPVKVNDNAILHHHKGVVLNCGTPRDNLIFLNSSAIRKRSIILLIKLEVRVRIKLTIKGFADLSLITWVPYHLKLVQAVGIEPTWSLFKRQVHRSALPRLLNFYALVLHASKVYIPYWCRNNKQSIHTTRCFLSSHS